MNKAKLKSVMALHETNQVFFGKRIWDN